jgi:hypothetical protein
MVVSASPSYIRGRNTDLEWAPLQLDPVMEDNVCISIPNLFALLSHGPGSIGADH